MKDSRLPIRRQGVWGGGGWGGWGGGGGGGGGGGLGWGWGLEIGVADRPSAHSLIGDFRKE